MQVRERKRVMRTYGPVRIKDLAEGKADIKNHRRPDIDLEEMGNALRAWDDLSLALIGVLA